MNIGKSLCLINLELMFDLQSLVLSIVKNYLPEVNIQDPMLQQYPLQILQQLDSEHFPTERTLYREYLKYIQILKPQLGMIETLHFLEQECNIQPILYCGYEDRFKTAIQQEMKDFPLYRFYEKADISVDVLKQGEFVIIFESRVEKCRELLQLAHNSNLKIVLIKNYLFRDHHYWQSVEAALGPNVLVCDMVQNLDWKWLLGKDTKPTYPETLYKICVHEPPLDKSIKGWSKYITLQPAITIESYIIAGFGRGGKMLGMPTANMEITDQIQESIRGLIPGIYCGMASLVGHEYGCAMSIGYNPYFNNTRKTIEVFLFNEFEQDFYGQKMKVQINQFIRPESDFKEFGHLIRFINNDIYLCKQIVQLLQ